MSPKFMIYRCLLFLTFIVSGVIPGCMVIPMPEHTLLEGRGKIEESDMAFLEKGKTLREDVLLRFGEPDLILDRDRILIYHWTVSHGYWFVGAGYSGAGGPIPKNYLIMLEFDEEGFLKRFEKTGSVWTSTQARLDKWISPDAEKPTSHNREVFIIDPIPQACTRQQSSEAPVKPVRFQMGEFRFLGEKSLPDNLIGHKTAVFSMIVADVRTYRPFIDVVRGAVTAQLETAGYQLVHESADVNITGDIAEFGVTTSLSLSSWDAIGFLDITLVVQSSSTPHDRIMRRYQSKHVSKTFLGPVKDEFEQVILLCLEDMQRQIASDAVLGKLLGNKTK